MQAAKRRKKGPLSAIRKQVGGKGEELLRDKLGWDGAGLGVNSQGRTSTLRLKGYAVAHRRVTETTNVAHEGTMGAPVCRGFSMAPEASCASLAVALSAAVALAVAILTRRHAGLLSNSTSISTTSAACMVAHWLR